MEAVKNGDFYLSAPAAEDEIIKLYEDWKKAIINHNFLFLQHFCSDDFTSTNCAGIVKNKAEMLARLRFKDVEYLSWEDKSLVIDMKEEKTVVKSSQTLNIQLYNLPIKMDREIALSFGKENNRWVLKSIEEHG